MPPKKGKKGKKRKAPADEVTNGHADDAPPDRATWPGWVEMESEPAFFNVMLSDMGVEGVHVQEIYGLEEQLAFLPKPIHALIFLFRYKDIDEGQSKDATECPDHVWFANQIPDFACATVALLNIVNNIKGLRMGKELRDFKEFTRDMDPMSRGDAIDKFDFVRQIHNSFARENELFQADQHYKRKIERAKRKHAAAKRRETLEAKKESKTPSKAGTPKESPVPQRSSGRTQRKVPKKAIEIKSTASSPLSNPPDSDPEFSCTPSKKKQSDPPETNGKPRRSARQPQPRKKDSFAASAAVQEEVEDEEGFHFIAFMPIQGHVWRMDGLDKFPQDMGEIDAAIGGDWMDIALPALQNRMALAGAGGIEFNLMAVVHDPILKDRAELAQNIKSLQAVEKKLADVVEDWRELNGADTSSNVTNGVSSALKLSESDIDNAVVQQSVTDKLEKEEDVVKLVEIRRDIVHEQAPLRGAVRDAMEAAKADQEKAFHRRHDYGAFVRGWLGALAEKGSLSELLEGVE